MVSLITTIRSTGHTAPAIASTIIASGGLLASVTCAVIAVAIFPAAMVPLIIGAAIGLAAAAAGVIAFICIARASEKSTAIKFINSNPSKMDQNNSDYFSGGDGSISSEESPSTPKIKVAVNKKPLRDEFNALLEKFRNEDGHNKSFRPGSLDSFNELKSSSLDELLTNPGLMGNGWTLPMNIMCYGTPDMQMELLNFLKQLNPALLEKILKQQDNVGPSFLMEAMCDGSSDVQTAVLELLGGLGDNVRNEVFKQQNNDGINVLAYAVMPCCKEGAWEKVKKCLMNIDSAQRKEIIDHTVRIMETTLPDVATHCQSRLNELRNMLRSA